MSIDERFESLCQKVPIVDTHNDFPYLLRVQLHNELHCDGNKFDFGSMLTSHTDLVRLKKGKVGIQFFSCFIECKDDDYLYEDFNKPNAAVRDTLEQIDVVQRLADEYPGELNFVETADEALESFTRSHGQSISITLGIEGLHQCDLSLAVLRQYYRLGVRYITLTHNCDNPFATAASSIAAGKPDHGLTCYGVDCIKEMNRLGLIVDLSHVSHKTMVDTLKVTRAPVIFSHSSVYTLTNHERNVRDDVLQMVKNNGGVVCINFFPVFLQRQAGGEVTIDDAVRHIKYVVDTIGWDHVGLGSDFDGIPKGPIGLEDVSKYPDLIRRVWEETGAAEKDIAKLMGLNVFRVWKRCEDVAKSWDQSDTPVESNWSERRWEFFEYCKDFPEIYPGSFTAQQNVYKDTQLLDNSKK
ncbi:hypothetical protein ZYGR_0N03840 [Zygosaccharomyces rouxii]|uniref:Dipeptidase n=2 Tax=Zygosaccharomyces rouxii TaxID=4956 RepID=C5DVS8_ZYGRC|nr:uncharacterized protein ZYRO0D09108g [Zygosaccharomyces rouxii]KAH9200808.1 renal dipeptidase family [Zygosaccharomyces rouxii]GAV48979.1 hypothetical protein ZYGR_0N03840 [Zygosaccharomyces rouxii]CAR27897.1 ZYRO0D09108p [Zygosaccharomyces rouxii]